MLTMCVYVLRQNVMRALCEREDTIRYVAEGRTDHFDMYVRVCVVNVYGCLCPGPAKC